jgi:ABC-type nitrate/sulfonate/bicarbonate transport system substrate-binding protein
LLRASPETEPTLAYRSQAWLSPRYQDDADRWGEQKLEIWQDFADFMHENGLIDQAIDPQKAFTNAFLP